MAAVKSIGDDGSPGEASAVWGKSTLFIMST